MGDMGVFHNCMVVLELPSHMSFKDKVSWRKKVTGNGGTLSYTVTKKVSFVVLFEGISMTTSLKVRQCQKYHVPVLKSDFIDDCLSSNKLLPRDKFILMGLSENADFKRGKIMGKNQKSLTNRKKKKIQVNLNNVKCWSYTDPGAPYEPDIPYVLAKWTLLKNKSKLQLIEIHVLTDEDKYRLQSQSGSINELQNIICTSDPTVWYLDTPAEVLSGYEQLHRQYSTSPYNMVTWTQPAFTTNKLGSPKVRMILSELCNTSIEVTKSVGQFVELLWAEALSNAEQELSSPPILTKLSKVEQAEAVLYQLKTYLKKPYPDEEKLWSLTNEFYEALPHKNRQQKFSLSEVSAKLDLCQLIRDIIGVGESTDWSDHATTVAKYKALRCHVTQLDTSCDEFSHVTSLVQSKNIEILNIYKLERTIEDICFLSEIGNVQLLMHSSGFHNFLGILSRGLLMPACVEDEHGVQRTDGGLLGSGIYFSNSASKSLMYSSPSTTHGSRLLLLSEVCLGSIYPCTKINSTLIVPPDGYNSVQGVKTSETQVTDFLDDEFVIYNPRQQRMKYVVEVALPGDKVTLLDDLPLTFTMENKSSSESIEKINLSDVSNVPDPLNKVTAGLMSKQKKSVPLKSVHVRAKLLDLVAKVVILQEYKNDNNEPIEAKYVFPLDDTAAVCGFEAFINGKHIIGEVKEKETAHKEYKEAISKGHGAYLMDEEEPDVFTVSVGNLPPQARVLIKITYIAELQTENEAVSFCLPSSVAPWIKDTALAQKTQSDLTSVKVKDSGRCDISVQVAIEMPFDIRDIRSPTHQIKMKKTATKAVVELPKNCHLDDGFQLLVTMAEIHVPRMWVENHPDKDSQACMLTFYPEFDANFDPQQEVVYLLDMSNSMKGQAARDAKKVFLLSLTKLPDQSSFNVMTFGTTFTELFPSPQLKTTAVVEKAVDFVQSSEPDQGGTVVVTLLQSLLLLSPPEGSRSIILISDGHVTNADDSLSLVRKMNPQNRIFTAGVGPTVNQHLMKTMALSGGGTYQYYHIKTKSNWQSKIEGQTERACQPGVSNVTVQWIYYSKNNNITQAPRMIPALFNGTRQVVYGYVPNCTQAKLTACIDGNEFSTMVSTTELNITKGKMLHQLTARAVIRDYEDGVFSSNNTLDKVEKMEKKSYIIDLSKEYSIVTPYTSFIAVEERHKDEQNREGPSISELVSIEAVDTLPYMGWQNADMFMEENPVEAVQDLLRKAAIAESFSQMEAERCYTALLGYLGDLNDLEKDENKDLIRTVKETVSNFCSQTGSEACRDIIKTMQEMFPEKMCIYVKTLTGKTVSCEINSTDSLTDLKAKLCDAEGIPPESQRLVYQGKQLEGGEKTIEQYGITDQSTLYLVLRLRGGPPGPALSTRGPPGPELSTGGPPGPDIILGSPHSPELSTGGQPGPDISLRGQPGPDQPRIRRGLRMTQEDLMTTMTESSSLSPSDDFSLITGSDLMDLADPSTERLARHQPSLRKTMGFKVDTEHATTSRRRYQPAPRKQIASKAARKSAPVEWDSPEEDDDDDDDDDERVDDGDDKIDDLEEEEEKECEEGTTVDGCSEDNVTGHLNGRVAVLVDGDKSSSSLDDSDTSPSSLDDNNSSSLSALNNDNTLASTNGLSFNSEKKKPTAKSSEEEDIDFFVECFDLLDGYDVCGLDSIMDFDDSLKAAILRTKDAMQLDCSFGDSVLEENRKFQSHETEVETETFQISSQKFAVQPEMCLLLLDVTPLTLGVETAFGTMTPVIKRNTTIPTRKSCLFTTFCDNQSNMLISIYEGERSRVKDNHLIGQLLLEGIVQVPKGVPRIEVTFDLDANGMLSVCACDKVTGKKNSLKIADKAKLKAADIATMVTNAEENKEEDQLWGLRLNEMIQLMDLAWRMKSFVNDKVVRARISDDYRRNIIKTCEELMAWLGTQHDTITIVEVKRRQCLFNDVCCGIMLLLEYDKAVMDIYRRMENFSELPMISQDKCIKY